MRLRLLLVIGSSLWLVLAAGGRVTVEFEGLPAPTPPTAPAEAPDPPSGDHGSAPTGPLPEVGARPPVAPQIRSVYRGSAGASPGRWLAEYTGDVLLVHFWASWCRPCEAEMASLLAFYRGPYGALRERGLVLLSVSNDVRMKDVRGFAQKHAVPFPIFYDSFRELNDRLRLPWIPGTVVIDSSGAVVDRLYGEQDWQSEELLARLESYLPPEPGSGKEEE